MKRAMYRLKMWTGPVAVAHFADKWREAGAVDVFGGTEHVYFDWVGDSGSDACRSARMGWERIHGVPSLPMSINIATWVMAVRDEDSK